MNPTCITPRGLSKQHIACERPDWQGSCQPVSDPVVIGRANVAGVILAGTHPWGDCLLDHMRPRPLLPVGLRPLVRYAVDWLVAGGVNRIGVCGNSHTHLLRAVLEPSTMGHARLVFAEDDMPRGPAGCVRDVADMLPRDEFVVVDGTTIPSLDLGSLLEAHRTSNAALTVVVEPEPGAGASVPSNIPAGIYVFSKRMMKHVDGSGYQDIKEKLIPKLRAAGERVNSYTAESSGPRVTGPGSYLLANEWVIQHLSNRCGREADAWGVDASATVHPEALLVGRVLIGPQSSIGRGAVIVGPTSIGANTHVAEDASISRSVIWDGCTIGRKAIIDRCVIGDNQSIEAGIRYWNAVCRNRQRSSSLIHRLMGRKVERRTVA